MPSLSVSNPGRRHRPAPPASERPRSLNYMALALDQLHYVILLPPVERCVAQVANRSGHGFTDEDATRHMHRQFAQAEIGQRHVLAGLAGPPGETGAEKPTRVQERT